MARPVLLVHGLGRTPLSLLLLARRLGRAGYQASRFGYAAFAESHDRILGRLTRRLTTLAAEGAPVGLVGHSLGGLLLREAVPRVPGLRVRALVMLGTPNQPPRLAQRVAGWRPFRLFSGSSGAFLASDRAIPDLPAPDYPYRIIAGTRGWRGRWSPFAGAPNDGFVAVDETRIPGAPPPLVLPVAHTFMMNNRVVQEAVLAALAGDEGPAA